MEAVSDPYFELSYEGKDITLVVAPLLLSLRLTDKRQGEADDISIQLDDSDLTWMGPYSPGRGDRIEIKLGYKDGHSLGPVGFEIDQPEWTGGYGKASVITLKGLATPVSATLREKKTQAWENVTLQAIAASVATANDLELVGDVPPIEFERLTQKEETDLAFLRRLAGDYGLIFKVEGVRYLVFYLVSALEAAEPVETIDRKQSIISSYRLRRSSVGTYKSAKVSYIDPITGKLISPSLDAEGQEVATPVAGESRPATTAQLVIREPFDNLEQARAIAISRLHRANRGEIKLSLQCCGLPHLSAGSNLTLTGFLLYSGKYQIESVTHSLDKRSGYRSSLELVGLEVNYDAE